MLGFTIIDGGLGRLKNRAQGEGVVFRRARLC